MRWLAGSLRNMCKQFTTIALLFRKTVCRHDVEPCVCVRGRARRVLRNKQLPMTVFLHHEYVRLCQCKERL